jgi:hypothetical protein
VKGREAELRRRYLAGRRKKGWFAHQAGNLPVPGSQQQIFECPPSPSLLLFPPSTTTSSAAMETQRPFPAFDAPKICTSCSATDKPLMTCVRCKSVKYCNKDCQKTDWPSHNVVCKELAKLNAPPASGSTDSNAAPANPDANPLPQSTTTTTSTTAPKKRPTTS